MHHTKKKSTKASGSLKPAFYDLFRVWFPVLFELHINLFTATFVSAVVTPPTESVAPGDTKIFTEGIANASGILWVHESGL
jgi:hypothetical protein